MDHNESHLLRVVAMDIALSGSIPGKTAYRMHKAYDICYPLASAIALINESATVVPADLSAHCGLQSSRIFDCVSGRWSDDELNGS